MSFSRYNTEDSVISSETVVRGMWTGDAYTLSQFALANTSPGGIPESYADIYNLSPTAPGSSVQFSIEYGHIAGSGSAPYNLVISGSSPSRVTYGKYRNLVYGDENTNFSFDGTTTAQQIYVININRDRYKQAIQPGSLNLTLASASGAPTIQLTDDSNTTSLTRFIGQNRVFYIITGSNGNYCTSCNSGSIYGMMFPDLGVIILDASGSLRPFISASNTASVSTPVYNTLQLYRALVAGGNFQLQSSEVVSSRFFFTRIKNSEFNYTTNPSIIDANGNLLYTTLINSPQTFITTVGMYNDNNELLAVAKLSKPLTKDFTKEALIRIKLDY
jgi:hypothetical protein